MIKLARRASRIPFAPVVAILFGVVAAILMAAVPQWLFERGVVASGLPGIIAAATPPLGLLARMLAIAASFLVITLVLWGVLGPLTARLEGRARVRAPWRDAGYDPPIPEDADLYVAPRKPIFAPEELGAPLMSDAAVAAMPPVTMPAATPPAPEVEPASEPLVSPQVDTSIAALIKRLEDGLARRRSSDRDPPGGAAPAPASEARESMADAPETGGIGVAGDADDNGIRQALGFFHRTARG